MRMALAWLLGGIAIVSLARGASAEATPIEPQPPCDLPKPAAKYEEYTAFARCHGMEPRSNRSLVIGLRGRSIEGKVRSTRIRSDYADTLVVLTKDRRVVTFAVSTHPWEKAAPGIPDVDGDGIADVGMIRPGKYMAVRRDPKRNIAGAPTYHLLTVSGSGKLPGFRNTDQDDVFSPAERKASEARGDVLTAVLFHREGGEGDPRPVGCQVLDGEAMLRFANEVGERFDYLLIDVNDARAGEASGKRAFIR